MKRVFFSFKYAVSGLSDALKTEKNIFIQLFIGLIGLLGGIIFQITTAQWEIGIITFTLVFSLELINTAIEEIVDSFTGNAHPGAKRSKDAAAAAVFTAFIGEIIIGIIIFLPHIFPPLTNAH